MRPRRVLHCKRGRASLAPLLTVLHKVAFAGLIAFLLCLSATAALAQTRPQPPVPLPTPFTPIIDNANVIDAGTRQRLESIYLNMKERGGVVYAVLTVPTTGDTPIFDYSLATARGWGIGPKGADTPSFLLVVAIQDRKYVTQVSHHLEGELPDGVVGQIQRERLVPAFRQQNYSKGIYDTVQAYIATIASKRGFSVEGIDQRYAYRDGNDGVPSTIREVPKKASLTAVCCGIIVVLFIVIVISRAGRGGGGGGGRGGWGRRRGWGGGGLLEALLWGSVLGNLGRGSSGWGSSSSGWGGGGFGGGGGDFGGGFGGGDTFGGGGAGGSW